MEMFRVRIDTENAAFEDTEGRQEIARILRSIANAMETGAVDCWNSSQTIYDVNGNDVGRFVWRDEEEGTAELITDVEARKRASERHEGQGSALYALASTGAILDGCSEEIQAALDGCLSDRQTDEEWEEHYVELHGLLDYVQRLGSRGPQKGWNGLSW